MTIFLPTTCLFSEQFIGETLLLKSYKNQFPFLSYAGVQCFPLADEEATEVEENIMKINREVKAKRHSLSQAIQLYIQLIFIVANRSYSQRMFFDHHTADKETSLVTRFLKLVSEHFLVVRKVADYADLLHVSADYLTKTLRTQLNKTAHELIDEMIGREAKAYLLHSPLSVAEIAYQLKFSDPSHFNKFFKKLNTCTPLQYRARSK